MDNVGHSFLDRVPPTNGQVAFASQAFLPLIPFNPNAPAVYEDFLNGIPGGALDTASYNSTAMVLPVYASDLGLAFQIIDDVLDVEGDAATLGKTAGKDAAGAKPSYPALFGLAASRRLAADCIDRTRSTLDDAGLVEGWLWPIAEWMVRRRN